MPALQRGGDAGGLAAERAIDRSECPAGPFEKIVTVGRNSEQVEGVEIIGRLEDPALSEVRETEFHQGFDTRVPRIDHDGAQPATARLRR